MQVNIQATGVELTEPIKAYADEKIGVLDKFFDNIQQIDIEVGRHSNHHQKGKVFYAEANVHIPGKVLRVTKDSETLYKAIDKVKDHIKQELKEEKEKMRRVDRKVLRESKGYQEA